MRVEEIALRSEIRQMLNEAGYNKETLKNLVKEVLHEEISKATRQAINETNLDKYIQSNINNIITKTTENYLKDILTRQVIGDWFHKLKVSVDVKDVVGESILAGRES